MTKEIYESMTLAKLKEIAKELEIKNISKYKKSELIDEILNKKVNTIEKDGVILKEKISPKTRENNSYSNYSNNQNNNYNNSNNNNYNNSNNNYNNQNNYQNSNRNNNQGERNLSSAETISGILQIQENNSFGFLRGKNCLSSSEDVYVSPAQIRRFNLSTGDKLEGKVREPKEGEKFKALIYLEKVNDENPENAVKRIPFEKLTPIYPKERIRLEGNGQNDLSTRLMDIICPIGKGQRGMIVAPPKAGKTTLLKQLAQNISKNCPEVKLIVLLIDERPEEVTDMQRSINGEVVYSTFDEEPQNHERVAQMILEHGKRRVEQGQDVVILLDSLTRLSRAYNLTITPTGRTLSGGLDPGSLIMPKKFFGAARNIEEGGSLTILATALVETGSRMDDMIFEEFKGTGNMEVHLDRKLQERRIFPAIDIYKSGTRKEDLLLSDEEREVAYSIRKVMYTDGNADKVTENLIKMLGKTKNNEEFIRMFEKSEI
ncbi:MAG: transcription termination factor Rho [Clostridium baratii]|uniref:Transcription termination factor Rho n=1 Tax=Clostridium baratii str. Sullivan TaxID=1415775 RepID=A0A0A7FZB2_9CLOT|nr:transcription termination factor Rho [Clostridium baratii]AIY84191.1 transcription termination factor Rho [Clostridium baratii str. Sullivan]MBS6005372.1 transcription termination factor Rho [Clostridium baratii]MDU1052437.1 transcription termination factor Rho [Clostridium baratii]MDU4909927.1 transcription termination factor Rho [Clostridium baratii]CUP37886.1 transcription termination factor Rho [Clostridium baratii]